MDIIKKHLEPCRKLLEDGASIDDVLQFLRDAGVDKARSMVTLNLLSVAELSDAKLVVHYSPVWADVRERDDRFHEQLEQITERIAARMDKLRKVDDK